MTILSTTCSSITGKILYSDVYRQEPKVEDSSETFPIKYVNETPTLNKWAMIPLVGSLAGISRMALAVIHMLGHTFAALIVWDKGHFCHVAKGAAEFLRGAIETIPIVGSFFGFFYDMPIGSYKFGMSPCKNVYMYSFFLIKIQNPQKDDSIDNLIDEGIYQHKINASQIPMHFWNWVLVHGVRPPDPSQKQAAPVIFEDENGTFRLNTQRHSWFASNFGNFIPKARFQELSLNG